MLICLHVFGLEGVLFFYPNITDRIMSSFNKQSLSIVPIHSNENEVIKMLQLVILDWTDWEYDRDCLLCLLIEKST